LQAWIDAHPLLFGVVFGFCVWNGVCTVLSFISGWALLARKYKIRGRFTGRRWWFVSGRIGIVPISLGLVVGANSEGLYLAMIPLFRPGCPPLLIPWSDTSVPRERSSFVPSMDFQIGTSPSIVLSVDSHVAEGIVDAARLGQKPQPLG
jgi:hypothetical protein